MKNVKPMVGQVWEDCHGKVKVEFTNDKCVQYSRLGDNMRFGQSMDNFLGSCKFIPQNDLEWLAVNRIVNSLPPNGYTSAIKLGNNFIYLRNGTNGSHTLIEIQSMRYELGLDECTPKEAYRAFDSQLSKDFEEFAKGCGLDAPLALNCKCITTPVKKETKMIDLSPFKIGDDLVTRDGDKVRVMFLSSYQMITEDDDGSGCLNMHKLDGTCIDRDATGSFCSCSDIVSRYEPRHWLKYLPDADLFDGEWLACENNEHNWYVYQGEPKLAGDDAYFSTNGMFALTQLLGIKMPALTGDEWKLSKISIVELRAWQLNNNSAMGV